MIPLQSAFMFSIGHEPLQIELIVNKLNIENHLRTPLHNLTIYSNGDVYVFQTLDVRL